MGTSGTTDKARENDLSHPSDFGPDFAKISTLPGWEIFYENFCDAGVGFFVKISVILKA